MTDAEMALALLKRIANDGEGYVNWGLWTRDARRGHRAHLSLDLTIEVSDEELAFLETLTDV